MNKIKVLIVDDHPLMREALRDAIETEADIEIVGEAVNGNQAVQMTAKLKPHVVLMDLYMPILDGIEATRQITSENHSVKILVITSSNEDDKVVAAIRAGAAGYLLKDSTRDRILTGLREVAMGRPFIPPEIGIKLAIGLRNEQSQVDLLTNRENEVLTFVGQGLANLEIAKTLGLSEATIRVHIFNSINKLNLQNRSQLAIYAQRKIGKNNP